MTSVERLTVLLCASTAMTSQVLCQQAATPRSLLAGTVSLLGASNLQSLTLSGTSETVAGSSTDSGTFSAGCTSTGSSQITLQQSAGTRTEKRQNLNSVAVGTWIDIDGTTHAIATQNLNSPSSWFCPALAIDQVLSASNLDITFIGSEQREGQTLVHFSVSSSEFEKGSQNQLATHLSQFDIFLDSGTFRPVLFGFNAHPDRDASVDIPVEIRFSNYSNVGGIWIPFTVERYVNSSLAMALKVQSALPNAPIVTN
jgi:hypothetical protein